MTTEQRAESLLDELIGEETTLGSVLKGREHDPNTWRPRGTAGESYRVILAAIREAVAAERVRWANLAEDHQRDQFCGYQCGSAIAAAIRGAP